MGEEARYERRAPGPEGAESELDQGVVLRAHAHAAGYDTEPPRDVLEVLAEAPSDQVVMVDGVEYSRDEAIAEIRRRREEQP